MLDLQPIIKISITKIVIRFYNYPTLRNFCSIRCGLCFIKSLVLKNYIPNHMRAKTFQKITLTILLLISINLCAQDGVLDQTFGNNGIASTDIDNLYDVCSDMKIQPDGKIIVVGHTSSGSTANKESIIIRYNADGSLDTTFGTDGIIIAAFSTQYDTLNAVEVQADGSIVVGGYTQNDFLLARFTPNGQLDSTFGTNGVVLTNYYMSIVSSSEDGINCIALQDDGKILVGGFANYFSSSPYAIARYNTDGTLDNTFGTDGKTLLNHNFNLSSGEKEIFDIIITTEGQFYAVGKAEQSHNSAYFDQMIAKFNSDGSLDTSFTVNGVRHFSLNFDSLFKEIKFQNDGKMVIVGNRGVAMTIVRLTENGVLDTTFNEDGRHTPAFPTLGGVAGFAESVSIQPDGNILMSGTVNGTGGEPTSVVVRYLPNGEFDPTFSDDGIFNIFVADAYQGGGFSAFQPNGMLVVGGDFYNGPGPTTDVYLYRITAAMLSTDGFSDADFVAYPNPVSNILYIQTGGDAFTGTYKLFSIDGKEVKIDPVQNLSGDLTEIDFTHLTSGVYLLSTEGSDTRSITRIIKE